MRQTLEKNLSFVYNQLGETLRAAQFFSGFHGGNICRKFSKEVINNVKNFCPQRLFG